MKIYVEIIRGQVLCRDFYIRSADGFSRKTDARIRKHFDYRYLDRETFAVTLSFE